MVRAERSAAPLTTDMETLGVFPNLPALVRAEQRSAAPLTTRNGPVNLKLTGLFFCNV
jgi:hypothetical protein